MKKYNAGDKIELILTEIDAMRLNDASYGQTTVLIDQITKHTPKPFDWADAKAGMAFITDYPDTGNIGWFLTRHPLHANVAFFTLDINSTGGQGNVYTCSMSNGCVRAPAHDPEGVL